MGDSESPLKTSIVKVQWDSALAIGGDIAPIGSCELGFQWECRSLLKAGKTLTSAPVSTSTQNGDPKHKVSVFGFGRPPSLVAVGLGVFQKLAGLHTFALLLSA